MSMISIVMPVYNTSKYLRECLDSIKDQTEQDWELLAVDDYSTDDSLQVLMEYAKADPRIKAFKNHHKGIIGALRLAFKNCQGELLTRMDSDDIMKSNKLEILKSKLTTNGKQHIACGPVKYFADFEIGNGFKRYENWLNGLINLGNNFDEIYKECVIPSPSWMCYTEDFVKCGGFLHDTYPEDYDLTFRFYKANLKCIPCDEILHLWRDYPNRTSRTHPNYADNTFIQIKINYFLQLDYDSTKKTIIWGAGKKGKKIARALMDQQVNFDWVCDNPKKIGHIIYNKELKGLEELASMKNSQNIVSIANDDAQLKLEAMFQSNDLIKNKDYFFLC